MNIPTLLAIASITLIPELFAETWPLWPEGPPGALGSEEKDIPTLTAYLPAEGKSNGSSFLVLPGGGYGALANHEGEGYAKWLAMQGITAYVLKYRLGTSGYRHPVMLGDAARGLRTVRAWARRDGLDPARIGIIGSSAGGHLASTLLVYHDGGKPDATDPIEQESSRPDLGVLCYPVISSGEYAHRGSFNKLLGENPPAELLQQLSTELQVTKETPPTFLWHTFGDKAVPVQNSLLFASSLAKAGVPFELHVYEKGGHGMGLPGPGKPAPPWDGELLRWLKVRGFMP
ncbi:MAG: alpha/beta hydrolase [Candidatus Methylacidiphilales bacterium]|nr:alpha/beta hydrolase [Candidatus Methylacidiphilales bacterium]